MDTEKEFTSINTHHPEKGTELRCTLQEWLLLDNREVARVVDQKILTAVIYLNGTRRWFTSQSHDWADYSRLSGQAQRNLSQLLYDHGVSTLIQPLMGYDLLTRGQDYLAMAVEQGLGELASQDYQSWYHQNQVRLSLFGNWWAVLNEMGFSGTAERLQAVMAETQSYTKRWLMLGLFADEPLDRLMGLARQSSGGQDWLARYYGLAVKPVDLIIGSGQPAIWDLPLLDINKASLYFLQAPTFCLTKETLRHILYDHLYERINDDELYDNIPAQGWHNAAVLGLGQRTRKGWMPSL